MAGRWNSFWQAYPVVEVRPVLTAVRPVLCCVCSDGSVSYKIFDKCAVRISVEETVGHRRQLVLSLVPREELPQAEHMA